MIDSRFRHGGLGGDEHRAEHREQQEERQHDDGGDEQRQACRDAVGLVDVGGGDAADDDLEVGAGERIGHDVVAQRVTADRSSLDPAGWPAASV